ncbi:CPBP family intramembrane glutamic endopeptidase [Lysobacter korlensis]|uniref:CPBP family intramembrane glutamic endopeptidase n=1 Tax=Lysobacter korlensis TaxID=553636 RepID=A0ABV6S0M7_9GAMM
MTIPSRQPRQAAATRRRSGVRGWFSRHPLLAYTLMAYGISWTLLIGGFFGSEAGLLNPDGSLVGVMIQVAAAGPLIAALIVLALTRGGAGLAGLARSLIRWRVNPLWYAFIFLGVPLLLITTVSAFYGDSVIPALTADWSLLYSWFPLQLVGVALVTGLTEEPGWRGFALPAANRRFQPMVAALVVSAIWAGWHLPNALFGQTLTETLSHLVVTVVNGLVLAWAYNSTGSVLIVLLLHGAQNAATQLVAQLLEGSTGGPSVAVLYLISALASGVLMAAVAVLTRGRLGLARNNPDAHSAPAEFVAGPAAARSPRQKS